MKKLLMKLGLKLIWRAAGNLGEDLLRWIKEAEQRGLGGREAFDYVWRKAKTKYRELGGWLLNLLIEAELGRYLAQCGELAARLEFPLN